MKARLHFTHDVGVQRILLWKWEVVILRGKSITPVTSRRVRHGYHSCHSAERDFTPDFILFSLVSAFSQKNMTYKTSLGVCVCVCVCVCLCTILTPPNNFQTSYPIDTKFWLHIVSYRNSPSPLILFINFENCAREKFLKFIFSPFN